MLGSFPVPSKKVVSSSPPSASSSTSSASFKQSKKRSGATKGASAALGLPDLGFDDDVAEGGKAQKKMRSLIKAYGGGGAAGAGAHLGSGFLKSSHSKSISKTSSANATYSGKVVKDALSSSSTSKKSKLYSAGRKYMEVTSKRKLKQRKANERKRKEEADRVVEGMNKIREVQMMDKLRYESKLKKRQQQQKKSNLLEVFPNKGRDGDILRSNIGGYSGTFVNVPWQGIISEEEESEGEEGEEEKEYRSSSDHSSHSNDSAPAATYQGGGQSKSQHVHDHALDEDNNGDQEFIDEHYFTESSSFTEGSSSLEVDLDVVPPSATPAPPTALDQPPSRLAAMAKESLKRRSEINRKFVKVQSLVNKVVTMSEHVMNEANALRETKNVGDYGAPSDHDAGKDGKFYKVTEESRDARSKARAKNQGKREAPDNAAKNLQGNRSTLQPLPLSSSSTPQSLKTGKERYERANPNSNMLSDTGVSARHDRESVAFSRADDRPGTRTYLKQGAIAGDASAEVEARLEDKAKKKRSNYGFDGDNPLTRMVKKFYPSDDEDDYEDDEDHNDDGKGMDKQIPGTPTRVPEHVRQSSNLGLVQSPGRVYIGNSRDKELTALEHRDRQSKETQEEHAASKRSKVTTEKNSFGLSTPSEEISRSTTHSSPSRIGFKGGAAFGGDDTFQYSNDVPSGGLNEEDIEFDDNDEATEDPYSIVNMFAAEIMRQKIEEEKRKIYRGAKALADERSPPSATQVKEQQDEYSDDEMTMMKISNTKDVVDGREPRDKYVADPRKKVGKDDQDGGQDSFKKSDSPKREQLNKSKAHKEEQLKDDNVDDSDDSDDYAEDVFHLSTDLQHSNESNTSAPSSSAAPQLLPSPVPKASKVETADLKNTSGTSDFFDAQESSALESPSNGESDSSSSSFSSTFESSGITNNYDDSNADRSTVRLTPSELQSKLLSELALSDMLTEQLLQVQEMEKAYTVATANAETAKVVSVWEKEKQQAEMVEELRAQQQAYEMTLHKAVTDIRNEMKDLEDAKDALGAIRKQEPMTPASTKSKQEASGYSSSSFESAPPATPGTTERRSVENSASAYSEDFDTEEPSSIKLDKSDRSDKSVIGFEHDSSILGGGAFAREHREAAQRALELEEKMLKVRENAVREICKRQLKKLDAKNLQEGKAKAERKKIKRQKAAALADINRERWAIKGRMYRGDDALERLWDGRGGKGMREDSMYGDVLMRQQLYFLAGQRQDTEKEAQASNLPASPRVAAYGSFDKTKEEDTSERSATDADDSDVREMKGRLEQLRKRKLAAEKILQKRKKAVEKERLQGKIKEEEKLTDMIMKEALTESVEPPGSTRSSRRNVEMSVATGEDGYASDSFESFDGDNRSVRSGRANIDVTGDGRSRGASRSRSRSRSPYVARRRGSADSGMSSSDYYVEEVVDGDESSEFISSVDEDDRHEKDDESTQEIGEESAINVTAADQRRGNTVTSRARSTSEFSEALSYGMESFESFDAAAHSAAKSKGGEGAEAARSPRGGKGMGMGLEIEVPTAAGGGFDVGSLTVGSGTGGVGSAKSNFGERRSGRGRNANNFGSGMEKENVVRSNVNDDSDATDTSFDSIKIRIAELQRKVDKKKKVERKASERKRLIELEANLLRQLEADYVEEQHQGFNTSRSSRDRRKESATSALKTTQSVSEEVAYSSFASDTRQSSKNYNSFRESGVEEVEAPIGKKREDEERLTSSLRSKMSASALSNIDFSGEGRPSIAVGEFLQGEKNEEADEMESAILSDSFRSRSSGDDSRSDDEAAVRRTERRMMQFRAAVIVQRRLRGILARIRVNHRRAVMDRMVRKARAEEREKAEFTKWGLEKSENSLGEASGDASFPIGLDESEESSGQEKGGQQPTSTEEDIERMVAAALAAAKRATESGDGSPLPALGEASFASSSSDSDDLAARVEEALCDDSFASGFGASNDKDIEGLLSSMSEEHVENSRMADQAMVTAIEVVGVAAIDLATSKIFEEEFRKALAVALEERGVVRESAAITLQKIGRGRLDRRKSTEMKVTAGKEKAATLVQRVGRGRIGRKKSQRIKEVKKVVKMKESAATRLQAAQRAKMGRLVARQKDEVRKRVEAERVKKSVEKRAEEEARKAKERMTIRREKEAELRREEELKRKQDKLRKDENLAEEMCRDILGEMLQEEMDVALNVVEKEANFEEAEISAADSAGSAEGSLDIRGQGVASTTTEAQGAEEDDDDLYDFEGDDHGTIRDVSLGQGNVELAAGVSTTEVDWLDLGLKYLERVAESVNFEVLCEVVQRREMEREEDEQGVGGVEGKKLRRKKRKQRRKKEGKYPYISMDLKEFEGIDVEASLGSTGGDMEASLSSVTSSEWGESRGESILPLSYFLALETTSQGEEQQGDLRQSVQMRNKAVFDCFNQVIEEEFDKIYSKGGQGKGEGEGEIIVVGGLAGIVRGKGAKESRGGITREFVVEKVRKSIFKSTTASSGKGVVPWDTVCTVSSDGVYDTDRMEGDEAWGMEAKRREKGVLEDLVEGAWSELLEDAWQDMSSQNV